MDEQGIKTRHFRVIFTTGVWFGLLANCVRFSGSIANFYAEPYTGKEVPICVVDLDNAAIVDTDTMTSGPNPA